MRYSAWSALLLTANPAFAFTGLNNTWTDTSPMVSVVNRFTDNVQG